jgi:hypothetical protein
VSNGINQNPIGSEEVGGKELHTYCTPLSSNKRQSSRQNRQLSQQRDDRHEERRRAHTDAFISIESDLHGPLCSERHSISFETKYSITPTLPDFPASYPHILRLILRERTDEHEGEDPRFASDGCPEPCRERRREKLVSVRRSRNREVKANGKA